MIRKCIYVYGRCRGGGTYLNLGGGGAPKEGIQGVIVLTKFDTIDDKV